MNAPEIPEQPVPDEVWLDEDAGPVVRHYAMTSGRTRPTRGEFDLITLIMATRSVSTVDAAMQPELSSIIRMCQSPVSVAELATHLDLPAGTIRVLLGDLLDRGYIRTRSPVPAAQLPTERVFKAVLDGLRSL